MVTIIRNIRDYGRLHFLVPNKKMNTITTTTTSKPLHHDLNYSVFFSMLFSSMVPSVSSNFRILICLSMCYFSNFDEWIMEYYWNYLLFYPFSHEFSSSFLNSFSSYLILHHSLFKLVLFSQSFGLISPHYVPLFVTVQTHNAKALMYLCPSILLTVWI